MTDDIADAPATRRGQHVRANRDRSFDVALGARIRAFRVAALSAPNGRSITF